MPDWVRVAGEMFREHLQRCAETGVPRLLYDVRELELHLRVIDLYEAGVALAACPCAGVRIAFLVRPESTRRDHFFQTVASNRGALVRVCTEEQAALTWLFGEGA